MSVMSILVIFTLCLWMHRTNAFHLKAMSFNLRTSNAKDTGRGNWEVRKANVVDLMLRYGPDFIGTQESSELQYQFLLTHVPNYKFIGDCAAGATGNCDTKDERIFIMYDMTKWESIQSGSFALSTTPAILGSNTWNLDYKRMATWGKFKAKQDTNVRVCIINTHYDVRKSQMESSVLIMDQIMTICQPEKELIVLMGDLNTTPDTKAIGYLSGRDPIGIKRNPYPLVDTFTSSHGLTGTFVGAFQGKISSTVFDYVFANSKNFWCIEETKVIVDTYENSYVSDHVPIMTNFCVGSSTDCQETCSTDTATEKTIATDSIISSVSYSDAPLNRENVTNFSTDTNRSTSNSSSGSGPCVPSVGSTDKPTASIKTNSMAIKNHPMNCLFFVFFMSSLLLMFSC